MSSTLLNSTSGCETAVYLRQTVDFSEIWYACNKSQGSTFQNTVIFMAAQDITSNATDKWIFYKETVPRLLFVRYLIRENFILSLSSVYLPRQACFEHSINSVYYRVRQVLLSYNKYRSAQISCTYDLALLQHVSI